MTSQRFDVQGVKLSMRKIPTLAFYSLLVLLLLGCSIDLAEPVMPSAFPQVGITSPTLLPGSGPENITPLGPTTSPTTVPSVDTSPQTNVVTKTQIPVTWESFNLTGRLVYTNGTLVDNIFGLQIQMLDLVTGEVTTIFDAPKYAWIYYIAVSPDATKLLLSYSPPSEDHFVDQDIYIMPLDGSRSPKLLFTPAKKEDDYFEVEWSPDGKYIYMTHINYEIPSEPGQLYPLYTIYRMEYPDGQLEKVVEKAYWPRISPDSSKITYVGIDPFFSWNKLLVANVDGSNPQEVAFGGPTLPDIRDAPMFSPDGKSIFFSAPLPAQSYQPNLFDKLMGVQIAKAHSGVASDWWSVPVEGGTVTQLTKIQTPSLFGSFSPDGQHIASHSLNGIFVMKPDGSKLTMLIPNLQAIPGTVVWIP